MTARPQHTPTPWSTEAAYSPEAGRDVPSPYILGPDGQNVAAAMAWHDEYNANAARIVACVNALAGLNPSAIPALVEALRRIADTTCDHGPQEFCPRTAAGEALEKAMRREG
jgi:hypothetical protein